MRHAVEIIAAFWSSVAIMQEGNGSRAVMRQSVSFEKKAGRQVASRPSGNMRLAIDLRARVDQSLRAALLVLVPVLVILVVVKRGFAG